MHCIWPILFAGARMLRNLLRREGHTIGRKRVRILMTRMGIDAVSQAPHHRASPSASSLSLSAAPSDD